MDQLKTEKAFLKLDEEEQEQILDALASRFSPTPIWNRDEFDKVLGNA